MCSQLPSHSVCGHSTIVAWCVRVNQQSSSSSLQTTIVGPTKVAWCVPSFTIHPIHVPISIPHSLLLYLPVLISPIVFLSIFLSLALFLFLSLYLSLSISLSLSLSLSHSTFAPFLCHTSSLLLHTTHARTTRTHACMHHTMPN